MHTLDHQNQLSLIKSGKERSAHSNQIFNAKHQASYARNCKAKGIPDNEMATAIDSFSVSDDGK